MHTEQVNISKQLPITYYCSGQVASEIQEEDIIWQQEEDLVDNSDECHIDLIYFLVLFQAYLVMFSRMLGEGAIKKLFMRWE